MKKLLLTLAAGAFVATAAFGQASELYLTGNELPGSNWSPDTPIILPYTNNQYTYVFPENTTPTFKISTAKGAWSVFDNGALGTSSLKINEKIQLSSNSSNIVAPAPANYTMTITYEGGSYWMLLATDDGETPEVVAPEKVYIKGTANGWSANDNYVLDLTSNSMDKDGFFVYKGTLASLSGSFKLSGSATDWSAPINYGAGDDLSPVLGQKIPCWYDGQDFVCSGSFTDITLTFYWNPTSGSPSYLEASSDVAPSYPETLYLIGNANGNVFAENTGVANTSADEGVYTFSNITMAADSNDGTYGYFAFSSELSSWDTINANRVAPLNNDDLVAPGDKVGVLLGVDASWKILPGVYNFTVDLVNKTLSVTGDATEEPTPEGYPDLYIVGSSVNGQETWGASEIGLMSFDEETLTYTWKGDKLENKFKIFNGNWNDEPWNIGAGENTTIEYGVPFQAYSGNSTTDIMLPENTYVNNPVITLNAETLVVTLTGDVVNAAYIPEVIYFKGSFDDWGEGIVLETEDNVTYTATALIPDTEDLKVKLDAGQNRWYGYAEGQEYVQLSLNVATTLDLDANGDDWSFGEWTASDVEIVVNWTAKTMTLTPTKTDGVNSINAANGEEVIYNLQGLRVNRDNLPAGIYIINGKKVAIK